MEEVRVLTLEEALENDREHMWLQMRWWPQAEAMVFLYEHLPWLNFREWNGAEKLLKVTVKAEGYGKTWRCFNVWPADQESRFPWEDGEGMLVPEEEPED